MTFRIVSAAAASFLFAAMALCQSPGASAQPDPLFDDDDAEIEELSMGFPDPWEAFNRPMLGFNGGVDRVLINPIVSIYSFIVPDRGRRMIRRAFTNLNSLPVLINDMFQLEWKDAGVTTACLVINSTVGIGGLFAPAEKLGLYTHHSDFGQTLALAGTPSGPYLILPLVGPTTVRDGIGSVMDVVFNPPVYLLGPIVLFTYGGGSGITRREAAKKNLDALEETSIDFYAALRNAYYQNRVAQIWSRREHRKSDLQSATAAASKTAAPDGG